MAAANTDNRFRDNNKGGLFSQKGPYLPSEIGPMGPHCTGRMGPGALFYCKDRAGGGGANKGAPKIL